MSTNTSPSRTFEVDIIIPAYNAENTITRLLESIDSLELSGIALKVFAVNDASTDGTEGAIQNFNPQNFELTLLSNLENKGRAISCNEGFYAGNSPYVLFIDSDCYLKDPRLLQVYKSRISSSADVLFSSLFSPQNHFWGYYFNHSQLNKNILAPTSFSSTGMMCSRALLNEVNAFSEEFSRYGFEDRDLICRLSKLKKPITFHHLKDARIEHHLDETIYTYCNKFFNAGAYSSDKFRRAHPHSYSEMVYAKIDYELNGISNLMFEILNIFLPLLQSTSNYLISSISPNNHLTQKLVQLCAATSYWKGTKQRHKISSSS